jgi:hypothetical protein
MDDTWCLTLTNPEVLHTLLESVGLVEELAGG